MPSAAVQPTSARRWCKEIAALGGSLAGLVPPAVEAPARPAGAKPARTRTRMSTDTIRLADRMRHIGAVADDEGDDRGRAAAPAGRRRRRSRRRRAGLPDAGARHGGGARGARQPASRSTPRTWASLELREAVGRALPARTTASATRPTRSSSRPAASRRCFHAALALFGPGDEVITHAPGWPTIVEQIKLAGATPVIVRTRAEDGFALDGRRVPRRRDAAHARHRHQLAGQSDRRAAVGGRGARARRRGGARAACGS